ncbi:tetratricopeptide repeat-containing sensor histidine kinase [Flavihumibacter solisilvae]|uniref:histidine kinase n=1 Tax=Flavihumibacter solisilvae TaxID=1349421 RepID=A0A0C1IZT5_9BACT|nr:tetratricopeptide repeat-containing sensor histidine kinase [Flavihumibacter solisilvae]KIC95999.1 hypothetical protein OI18_02060 [Flavihumibacter solisilvae]
MKKVQFWLLVVLVACSNQALSQDTATQRILSAKDDSVKVVQLADHAYKVSGTDKKKGLELYAELMRLSRKLNYQYWIGMSWYNIGYVHARAADDKEAMRNFDSALVYLKRTDRLDMTSYCHLNIASLAGRLGDTDKKMQHLNAVIALLQNSKHTQTLNYTYNSLGVLYFNLDDYDTGLTYFRKAESMARQTKDTMNLVDALHGIVNCLSSQKKFVDAEPYGKEALAMAYRTANKDYLTVAHTAVSELYYKWGKAPQVLMHAKKIVEYATETQNVQYQLIGTMGLADGYLLAKDYKASIANYNMALQLGSEKGAVIQLDDIYKGLSEAYSQTGQPGKALESYKKFITYRDSANNEKVKKHSVDLDKKYQLAQKEKALSENQLQLALKDLQLAMNTNYVIYAVSALAVALLVVGLLLLRSKYRRLNHAKELNRIRHEKELHLLQALMQGEEQERGRIAKELHDGVAGMLAASKMHLSSMPGQGAISDTDGYRQGMFLLNEATQEIRKTSHNLMPEILLANGLDEALRWYCNNISGDLLSVQYDSWGDLRRYKPGFELSVYRIVQELLGNIIKHSKATQAIVQMSVNENTLSLTVEDNGIGFASGINTKGMGITSVQSRVVAMNGRIEMEASPGNGVSAYLEFDTTGLVEVSRLTGSADPGKAAQLS